MTRTTRPDGDRTGIAAGLVLALALVPSTRPTLADDATPEPPVIHHNSRAFRVPLIIPSDFRDRIKEVRLCVSDDLGRTWTAISKTTPDGSPPAFRAPKDGEYWFTTQSVDFENQLTPPLDSRIEPRMKVIVDTVKPDIALAAVGRRGGEASVRWEIRDERLDRKSFVLEYQAQGARDWREVQVRKPAPLVGEATWEAGTAEPIRVRATVSDRARNKAEKEILLPDGTAQGFEAGGPDPRESNAPPPRGDLGATEVARLPAIPSRPPPSSPDSDASPFDSGPPRSSPPASHSSSVEGDAQPRLIRSPRFNLRYQVDEAGPDGPARVDLWLTQDAGKTWSLRESDPDRKSPFPVDLGGEGTFGLTLVARSASDLGDQAPAPGDRPQQMVTVDSTPPSVQLEPIGPITRASAGKIAINWHAGDLHLGPTPVTISVRRAGSSDWVPIGPPMRNSGRLEWTVPSTAPDRFFVKVQVVDRAGNVGSDETPEGSPVLVDRSRPRSRIIGLEPSAMNATGPGQDAPFR